MIKHDFFSSCTILHIMWFFFVVRMTYSVIIPLHSLRNIFSSLHTALGFDQNTCPQIIFWKVPITILVRPIRQRFGNVIIVLYHRYMYFCVRCYMYNYMNYLPNNIICQTLCKEFFGKIFSFCVFSPLMEFAVFCITARLNHFLYMTEQHVLAKFSKASTK